MPPPDKESVLRAMRSDLGLGRVEDLELENGRRGQTTRPSQAIQVVANKPALPPPRNPLPGASRWKAAIEKGEFDDDDAEAVKGLDRIAGGRLHAQKPATALSGQSFHPRMPPPAGLPRNRPPVSFQLSTNAVRSTQNLGIPKTNPLNRLQQRPAHMASAPTFRDSKETPIKHNPLYTDAYSKASGHPDTNSAPVRQLPLPPTPPQDALSLSQADIGGVTSEAHATQAGATYVRESEPQDYFYRAEICVADRLAKGKGAVYLLVSSPSDPGTISVYLEGLKYLEYPVMRMFNYITSTTELCPQFKEADGVSITTTSLVFGSQERIARFMQAVKTLRSRQPASVAPHSRMGGPIQPVSQHTSLSDEGLDAQKRADAEMTSDLVDLSQPTESSTSKPFVRTGLSSTYAMDLESLCSSAPGTSLASSASDRSTGTAVQAASPREESFTPTPADPDAAGTPALPYSAHATLPQDIPDPKEALRSALLDILPTFEAMCQVLGTVSKDNRENLIKAVFASIQTPESPEDKIRVSSAKQLLKALLSQSPEDSPGLSTAFPTPSRGPQYTRKEIIRLRQPGIPPPKALLELDFVPRPGNPASPVKEAIKGHRRTALAPQMESRRDNLKPDAATFHPKGAIDESNPPETCDAQRSTPFITAVAAMEKTTPALPPTALSFVSNSSNTANTAVPAVAAQPLPPRDANANGSAKKGLQGSRWATAGDHVVPKNAHPFTGIGLPY